MQTAKQILEWIVHLLLLGFLVIMAFIIIQRIKALICFLPHMIHLLFLNAYNRSGFILPEYALFDQQGNNVTKEFLTMYLPVASVDM